MSSTDVYWVSEDLADATPVKVHDESCGYVKRKTNTTTTQWHGPFDLQTAESTAAKLSKTKGWHRAQCCMR